MSACPSDHASAPYRICAFYRFMRLDDPDGLQTAIRSRLLEGRMCGTVLLACEGINGTVAGLEGDTRKFFRWLQDRLGPPALNVRESWSGHAPFKRTRVKLKKEIVTLGIDGISPIEGAGTHVKPEDWDALIEDPDVLLIDVRNEYEIEVGRFRNAISPGTASFREFPEYAASRLDPARHRKIAMYCTGGIRCEKAAAFLEKSGFGEVFQLQGGILHYLEKIPANRSSWEGECFVFDERTALNETLDPGQYDQCHACRRPVSEADKQDVKYIRGVSCPKCHDQKSDRDRMRYAERERQTRLADLRGDVHIGPGSRANPAVRKAGPKPD
ncbi:MAG: rhodanese-related sulfurtransferase [Gammaproteobacteria bacterium]|nr:rhodanese-related sulfurtransferase [Gammaproteobacteria bacterium]MYD76692.1 rhodanese-related sulfurtransferase [Gammaproteobacteria bacterium]MYJ52610.1 rhodanese-related sulfurtransferase [Gammaproteobacteria bacterium]